MNIGIYGTSIAKWDFQHPDHFISLLQKQFNANIVQSGIGQCSEERILFNIKKQKNLDFAVIFHTSPHNVFVPAWNRDVTNIDRDTFNKKINLRDVVAQILGDDISPQDMESTIELINKIPNGACFQLLENFGVEFTNYSEVFSAWANGDDDILKELLLDKVRSADEDEEFFNELYDALKLNKKFMSHPDLQMNRFFGAFIQIDQYLNYKKIPCIHFLDKEHWYPTWYEITSGPVNKDAAKMHRENSPYYVGYTEMPNGLSKEANYIIFEEIKNAVSSIEVNAPSDQLGEGGSIPPAAPVQRKI